MLNGVDFPELTMRTGRFSYGAPHAVVVGGDGARVAFLRSAGPEDPADALWVLNVATGAETRVAEGPIEAYATDRTAQVAAYVSDGRLFRADLIAATAAEVPTAEPVLDPHPDPTGQFLGYVTPGDCLRIVSPDGTDDLLAG